MSVADIVLAVLGLLVVSVILRWIGRAVSWAVSKRPKGPLDR